MPPTPTHDQVVITVRVEDLTDQDLTALKNGIAGLVQHHPGALVEVRATSTTTPAVPPPPEPTPEPPPE